MDTENDWWAGIDGQGTMHELRTADEGSPRLYGLKSVSKAACWAIHKKPVPTSQPIGFHRPTGRGR